MADSLWVGGALYEAEDVAKLIDELCAARLVVAPPLPWQIRAETDKIRAEVAEGIARAIEANGLLRCPTCRTLPDSISFIGGQAWCPNSHMWVLPRGFNIADTAAAIARDYTATATGTPTSDAPAHRLEHQ